MTASGYRRIQNGHGHPASGPVRRTVAGGRVSYGVGNAPRARAEAAGAPMQGAPYPPASMVYPQGHLVGQQVYPAGAVPAWQHAAQPAPQRKRRRIGLWVALLVALVCLVAGCLLALSLCDGPGRSRAGAPGQLEGKTPEEIQAELDRQVSEGMFNISIASVAQFADGTSEGELRIENVPGNRYLMQVVITLDDTGQQIYESGIIEPDHHIQRDALSVDLDPGTYDATATFLALDAQTEEEAGRAAAKMLIQVMG